MKTLLLVILFLLPWPLAAFAQTRSWTDRISGFSTAAEFIAVKNGKVYLETQDGAVLSLRLRDLSYQDCDYLRSLAKDNRKVREHIEKSPLPTEHTVFITSDLPTRCNALTFSPDGRSLAVGTGRGVLMLDLATMTMETTVLQKWGDNINFCRFTPDGRKLLTGKFGSLDIWGVEDRTRLVPLKQHKGHYSIQSMTFSPAGKHILAGYVGPSMRYWDLETGEDVHDLKDYLTGAAHGVFINPKGTQALTTDGNFLVLLDLISGVAVQKMKLLDGPGKESTISPDGTLVAVADREQVHVWKTVQGTKLPVLESPDRVYTLEFSADGSYLVAGCRGSVALWRVSDFARLHVFQTAKRADSKVVATSPDSRYVATTHGTSDDTLQVFRMPPVSP